jgi:hypothetical protein
VIVSKEVTEVPLQFAKGRVVVAVGLSKNIKPTIYRIVILPGVLYGCETWYLPY